MAYFTLDLLSLLRIILTATKPYFDVMIENLLFSIGSTCLPHPHPFAHQIIRHLLDRHFQRLGDEINLGLGDHQRR